jgi:hypothetical protein
MAVMSLEMEAIGCGLSAACAMSGAREARSTTNTEDAVTVE